MVGCFCQPALGRLPVSLSRHRPPNGMPATRGPAPRTCAFTRFDVRAASVAARARRPRDPALLLNPRRRWPARFLVPSLSLLSFSLSLSPSLFLSPFCVLLAWPPFYHGGLCEPFQHTLSLPCILTMLQTQASSRSVALSPCPPHMTEPRAGRRGSRAGVAARVSARRTARTTQLAARNE